MSLGMFALQVADVCLLVVLAALIAHWAVERRRLRRFVHAFGVSAADPRHAALEIAGRLFGRPRRDDDPPYLAKCLAPLGATAGDVIELGGCCSGTSRLYILCLAQLGIRAHQITVYHWRGYAQHCLVEASLPDGPLIADPCYGLYYTDETGRPIGLEDLQRGVMPVFAALPHSDQSAYPAYGYYKFDFTLTKTANWTKSLRRRYAHRVLAAITRGRVNRLRLPVMLEWPHVVLGGLVVLAGAVAHAFAQLARF